MLRRLIEPGIMLPEERRRFSNRNLVALVLPLLGEQFFIMLVGLADTLMISYAGEAAVSGVSLVNLFITVFIFIFNALASGGAVVVSQYIGSRSKKSGVTAASQLITVAAIASTVFMALVLIFHRQILQFLFGRVDAEVMSDSITYIKITALSLPGLAIYNAGAAVFRSMSKTRTTMLVSVGTNIVNVIGNAVGIFVLRAGVAGVAWPSFIARTLSAVIILLFCLNRSNQVYIRIGEIFALKREMIRRILRIAIPGGVEGGIFQATKLVLGTITALFGTVQIAANGIAQSLWSMAALSGVAMAPAFVTVVGQMMGRKDIAAAKYYMMKLLRISYMISFLWNGLLLLLTPLILNLYDISSETRELIIILVIIHNLFQILVFPVTLPFANGLRAAGDVKFVATVTIVSTVAVRILLSIVLGLWLRMGVIGIAIAMVLDWSARAIFLGARYKSGRWLEHDVIQ